MNLDERIQLDISRGDYGTARVRLLSRLNEHGYSADLMARLGRVSFDMRDPISAGRYWIFSNDQGPEVDSAIDAFSQRFGRVPTAIISQLPQSLRTKPISFFPAEVQARLRSHGIDEKCLSGSQYSRTRYYSPPSKWDKWAVELVLWTFMILIILSVVVGAYTIVRWMF